MRVFVDYAAAKSSQLRNWLRAELRRRFTRSARLSLAAVVLGPYLPLAKACIAAVQLHQAALSKRPAAF
ncbi:hypothetical protein [Donghicola eburneus]|uniref:hypothetical protein n=1 Tax=Donghicola eburneus TaxID=393278 RepID=UPI00116022A1|nr:hypothetical protein [Donghicola eburneus]